MVEHIAILIGSIALMFFTLELSFRLQDGPIIEGALFSMMDFIKVILLFISFVLGLFVIWFMMLIGVENSASQGLQDASTTLFWFWMIVLFLIMAGLGLYFLWWMPNVIKKAEKANKRRMEDND